MLLKVAAALGLLTTYAITHVAAGVVPITSQDDSEIVLSAGSALPCDLAIQASQPVKLSDLSQSAAVEGIHQNTRVYYQTSDGAIWEAAGVGLPNPSYSKKIILPAGKARVYSPIAVTAAYDFRVIYLYYIRLDGTLGEWVYRNNHWGTYPGGGLDDSKIPVLVRSSYLYALSDEITEAGYANLRVGFLDKSGVASEVYHIRATSGWKVVQL